VKELVTRTAALYGELASKDSSLLKLEAENRRLAEAVGGQEEAEARRKAMQSRNKVMEAQQKSLEESMARASQTIQSLQEVSFGYLFMYCSTICYSSSKTYVHTLYIICIHMYVHTVESQLLVIRTSKIQ